MCSLNNVVCMELGHALLLGALGAGAWGSLCPTGKRAGTCFGSSRTHILLLFSALPSLTCEVSLTKVNSKVLRSSQLVSAGGGRNAALGTWALPLWDMLRTCPRCP